MESGSRDIKEIKDIKDKTNIHSDSRTNTDTSKSAKSVKSNKKKTEVSAITILSSIEREISDLIQEIAIRSQKNKLFSIQDSIKLLTKKFLSGNLNLSTPNHESYQTINSKDSNTSTYMWSNSIYLEESLKHKEEIEIIKKSAENEIKKLNEEVSTLQNKLSNNSVITEFDNKLQKKDEQLAKLVQKLDQMSYLFSEEKIKNNNSSSQIKKLEEALETLNNEYNLLSYKFGKAQNECNSLEKTIANYRKNNSESKYKFDDLVKINSELKNRLIESENTLKLHTEDLKSLLKKYSLQQKYIDELETKNKQFLSDFNCKEERLQALRIMNSKLEQKSHRILKKWETFRLLEEKNDEISQNSQRMMEVIEDLNNKLSLEIDEKDKLSKTIEIMTVEKDKILLELEESKKQLKNTKYLNDELMTKNQELENKFKRTLDQKNESRENSSQASKDRSIMKTSGFHSNVLNNMTLNMNKTDPYTQKAQGMNNENTIDELKSAR